MFKNVSGQKIALFNFNSSTGVPNKTDSANMTIYLSKDFGTVTSLANSTIAEMDSTNAPGWYMASVSSTETNADTILFTGKTTTASGSIVGTLIYTVPPNFTTASIDASGRFDLGKILGSAVDTTTTQMGVRVNNFNGNAFDSTAAQVGVRLNNIGTSAVDTTSAQLGVRVNNFNGNAFDSTAAQVGVRLNNIVAAAVNTTIAQLGVTVIGNIAGSVAGTVGGVAGNVTGSVSGTVGGVAGNVTGSVSGTVGGVAGNVTGSVAGTVAAVAGNVTGSVAGVSDVNIAKVLGATATSLTAQLGVNVVKIDTQTPPSNFSALAIDSSGNVAITSNVKKNTAKSGFMFVMTDSTNHAPTSGLSITATRSLDGAAFASTTNTVTEVANGTYVLNLSASDTNADHVMLRLAATGADDLNLELITQP